MKSQKKSKTKTPVGGNNILSSLKNLLKKEPNPFYYSLGITAVFFAIALFGMLHHEMWRDEHQAWLIARESHSLTQLYHNLRFEGHPALWHILLYFITCFTHNPAYMQALHLLIACGFIYVFNRYSGLEILYKILFSFGYFTLYEYTVISRDYGLAVLLIFIICALYKNRTSNYILLGITLALLANVSIYGVIISLGIAMVLALDYFIGKRNNNRELKKLFIGLAIVIIGASIAIYMIIPDKENTFLLTYPKGLFEFNRWTNAFAKIFMTYFYIPETDGIQFWNTTFFYSMNYQLTTPLWYWFMNHQLYLLTLVILPTITFLISIVIFIRKPLILLLYAIVTLGILSMLYYTNLLWIRYCGFLLIILIVCYWLSDYYQDKNYHNLALNFLSKFGKKIQTPFLILVLSANVIGAAVAYEKDYNYEFTTCKDAADYIRENRLDTLKIACCIDYTAIGLATYLDTKLFYPQMNDYGTFCLWSKDRKNKINVLESYTSIVNLMEKEKKTKLLFVSNYLNHDNDGRPFERGMIGKDVNMYLIKSFESGVVRDEQYYIYMVQKVNPKTIDLRQYPKAYEDLNDPNGYISKGNDLCKMKNYSKAIEEYEKAIAAHGNGVAAYRGIGAAYGSMKQYQSAIENLNKAAELDSNDSQVQYFLGISYMKMGDTLNGNKYLEKANRMRNGQ